MGVIPSSKQVNKDSSNGNRRAEVLKQLEDSGLDELPELFDQLLDMAKGLKVYVRVEDIKPFGARKLSKGRLVETEAKANACPACKRSFVSSPHGEVVEVYRYPPDKALLRYLHEYLAGKARAKEERQVDPVIIIQFPAIDTVHTAVTHEEAAELDQIRPEDDPLLTGEVR